MPSLAGSSVERRPWRWRDAIPPIVVGLAAAVVAAAFVGEAPTTLAIFGVVVPAQMLGMLGAVTALARRREDWRRVIPGGWGWSDLVGVPIGVGVSLGLSILAYWIIVGLFGGEVPTQQVVESVAEAIEPWERVLVVVGAVLLGPLAEEVVFRGILLSTLRRDRSDRIAIATSAGAFAALHLLDPSAVFAVPFLFVAGLVMGRAVVVTGRLARAVAIHVGFNLVSVVALFAAA